MSFLSSLVVGMLLNSASAEEAVPPPADAKIASEQSPSPDGFLVHPVQRERHSFSFRSVAVFNPGEVNIGQITPRVQTSWRYLGLDVEQTFIDVWAEDWAYNRAWGNRRMGFWFLPKTKRITHGVGLEWTHHYVSMDEPQTQNVSAYWGSQSRETIDDDHPSLGDSEAHLMGVWQATWTQDVRFTTRLAVGSYLFDIGLVLTAPVNDRISVVLEQDWVPYDHTPATLRPLARIKAHEHVDLDLGVQIPYREWRLENGPSSAQIVLQAGGRL